MSTPIPGEQGFALVTYKGKAKTERDWAGPITGATYVFGGDRVVGLVDIRDASTFTEKLFDVENLTNAIKLIATDAIDAPVIEVTFVRHRGGSVIVEHNGYRYYVPRFALDHGPYKIERAPMITVPESVLMLSIPYGDDFESIFADVKGIDAKIFACELRKANVWTLEDYHARAPVVYKIIHRLIGLGDAIARAQSKLG